MFGPTDPKAAARRVADGAAWREFCDVLKVAGVIFDRPGTPDDPQTRAEGLRYLTRLTRAALETFVENADPLAPVLQRVVHETVKMGADNPDNFYQNAAISGAHRYRLWGHRGSVQWLEFATQEGAYGQGRGMPPTGRLDARDMHVEPDGTFEITASCDEPAEGNWLPMRPEAGTLIIRQSRLNPAREQLARVHIERIGGANSPSPLTAQALDQGLRSAGMLVGGAAAIFAGWAEGFTAHTNRLPRFDPALSDSMGGVADIAYYHSYWRLAHGERLVITADPPPCDHWNLQLNNHWMESLDYRHQRIWINSAAAVSEPDGSIKIIVSHDDPGHPNWVRTDGHTFGTMCFRWVRPEVDDPPEPACEVVQAAP